MNELLLSRRLGVAGSHALQRVQYERLLQALTPEQGIKFDLQQIHQDGQLQASLHASGSHKKSAVITRISVDDAVAHNGGVNVLAIDQQTGRYLISGGADSAIRLWDLELRDHADRYSYHPTASVTRFSPDSHTHALTSLSIYPFDPVPSTFITTSYDKTLKLFSVDAARIAPVHTFDLIETPYTHGLSPVASSATLIAVGTAHPAVKLVDLRTGLATHTLPGHNGAVFSVCWSPRSEHLLASGAADGRVLFFDVRRAHSAFACLDHDDAIGIVSPDENTYEYQPRAALNWNAKAHSGPVTGVRWADGARKLVTCGHDQRIRVWDAATGRNELVHFGPRIRNARNGEFNPLASPTRCCRSGAGTLLWANDDTKGEIFIMDMNEGTTQTTLKTPGTSQTVQRGSSSSIGRLTSGGRINSMAWRLETNADRGLELYSAHGNGSIHCWVGVPDEDDEVEDQVDPEAKFNAKHKRKRDLLEGIVEGLTKKAVTFT